MLYQFRYSLLESLLHLVIQHKNIKIVNDVNLQAIYFIKILQNNEHCIISQIKTLLLMFLKTKMNK